MSASALSFRLSCFRFFCDVRNSGKQPKFAISPTPLVAWVNGAQAMFLRAQCVLSCCVIFTGAGLSASDEQQGRGKREAQLQLSWRVGLSEFAGSAALSLDSTPAALQCAQSHIEQNVQLRHLGKYVSLLHLRRYCYELAQHT